MRPSKTAFTASRRARSLRKFTRIVRTSPPAATVVLAAS
jgi:hypothetical protein